METIGATINKFNQKGVLLLI